MTEEQAQRIRDAIGPRMAETAPSWLIRAASYLGFHEIGNNLGIEHFIDDAHTGHLGDPWCAIFVNACLEEAGVPGTRSAAARSFEHSNNFVALAEPALGCIVTRWRGSPQSGNGHVFFYCGENENGIVAIAGNEADAVRRYYETNRNAITGYWWPVGTPLPTGGRLSLPVEDALKPAPWEGAPQALAEPASPPPRPTPLGPSFTITGKCSTFGGPDDDGMSPTEGLAIWSSAQMMRDNDKGDLLLPNSGFPGLGRSLNPNKFYLACRWDYSETPISMLRTRFALVEANGKSALMTPVDWGPNVRTGRVADLSPGGASALGVKTDDTVTVTFPAPTGLPKMPPITRPEPEQPPKVQPLPLGVEARLNLIISILQRLESRTLGSSTPPAPTSGGSMGALAVFFPWLATVLPQIGTALIPVITALATTGVMGTPIGPDATPTGQTAGASAIAAVGVGIFNWIKAKWFTPPKGNGNAKGTQ